MIVVVANAVNVVLNVVFIYGFGWGLAGSAWATVVAQAGMGAAFVRALLSAPADSRRPSLARMRPLARIGGEIFVRTAALYGSFLVASAVLARVGKDSLAAHQIAFQLFVFLALVLDAIAIAGQVIVGRTLGAGDAEAALRRGAADDRVGGGGRRRVRPGDAGADRRAAAGVHERRGRDRPRSGDLAAVRR